MHSAFYSTKCTCMWFLGPTPRDSHWVHMGFSFSNAPSQVILMFKWRKTKRDSSTPKSPNRTHLGTLSYISSQTVWWSRYSYPHLKRESLEAKGLKSCIKAQGMNQYVLFYICCSFFPPSGCFIMFPFWLQISFHACLPIFLTTKKPWQ